jgi:hypothetical protein
MTAEVWGEVTVCATTVYPTGRLDRANIRANIGKPTMSGQSYIASDLGALSGRETSPAVGLLLAFLGSLGCGGLALSLVLLLLRRDHFWCGEGEEEVVVHRSGGSEIVS